jgi:hypothetical protein
MPVNESLVEPLEPGFAPQLSGSNASIAKKFWSSIRSEAAMETYQLLDFTCNFSSKGLLHAMMTE